jgi:hypothetical protein
MDAQNQNFRGNAKPAEGNRESRQFARRIDCAPTPRRPDEHQPPVEHGYPRAPGEDV